MTRKQVDVTITMPDHMHYQLEYRAFLKKESLNDAIVWRLWGSLHKELLGSGEVPGIFTKKWMEGREEWPETK